MESLFAKLMIIVIGGGIVLSNLPTRKLETDTWWKDPDKRTVVENYENALKELQYEMMWRK